MCARLLVCLLVLLSAATLASLSTVTGAEASTPIQLAYLQCLQPVTLRYAIPITSAGNLSQEAVFFEEVLANAGLPEPLVEIRNDSMRITTYAASQPDLERLEELIRRELGFHYPGYRPLQEATFVASRDYGQQAMEVVARRLRLAGYEGQCGLLGSNRFWVSAHTDSRDLGWAWGQLGLFEVRLLPGDVYVGLSRGTTPDSPWQATATRKGRPVNLRLLVRRSPLVISNRLPALEANVWQIPDVDASAVSFTLAPSAAARLKEMTRSAGTYTLAYVWNGRVVGGLTADYPVEDARVSSPNFDGDVGRREAARLAFCLESGPLPTPLAVQPPKVEIPASVTAFLRRTYPGWRLITYDDYGPAFLSTRLVELRRRYGENYHPFAVWDDFDGDGKADWAVLLKRGEQVRLIALHHAGTTWTPHLVSESPYRMGFPAGAAGFSLHLEPRPRDPSRHNWDLGPLADLPGTGFELVCPGKVAWLWRWDGGHYQRFVSRDQ